MFEYVLIASELIMLTGFFWYVFIREPKPFELKENLWGVYDPRVDAFTARGAHRPAQQPVEVDHELSYAIHDDYADYESAYSYSQSQYGKQNRRCNNRAARAVAREARLAQFSQPTIQPVRNNCSKTNGWIYVERKQSGLGVVVSVIGQALARLGTRL